MKKFFKSLTDLSLVQQMAVIVVTFVLVMLTFFGIYLRGNIGDLVTSQTLSMVQRSQENLVTRIRSGDAVNPSLDYDRDVMHFVYNKGKLQMYVGVNIYEEGFLTSVNELLGEQTESLNEGSLEFGNDRYYYRYYVIDKNREVISFIAENYAKTIEDRMIRDISYTSALTFSLIFIVLMFWCLSLITPLQQMRDYINKVRKGEDAELKVERGDEIGELARELITMREEIKHQEETKEEMIHNISHDLKTPIATIKSYAESIKDGIYPYDTLEKSVDVIIDNAGRLENKVHSLLFLNRLDYMMDQAKNTEKATNMEAVIETVLLSLKMIKPEILIIPKLETVIFRGDEESWRVVVENLLDNALRYATNIVEINLKEGELSVFNDGEPLSEERMKKLFRPFEKGTNGRFGLGLSICYKVCHAYDYEIYGENRKDGVIFVIDDRNRDKKDRKKNKH